MKSPVPCSIRLPFRSAAATFLIVWVFLSCGCAQQPAPPASETPPLPEYSSDPLPEPSEVSGTGILFHEQEEQEISLRMSRVASVPATKRDTPRTSLPAANGDGTLRVIRAPVAARAVPPADRLVVMPGAADGSGDIYALSPHARLLAQPSRMRPFMRLRPELTDYASVAHAPGVAPDGQPRHMVAQDAIRPAPAEWEKIAREAGEIFGLDAALVLAVIRAESAFNHAAESPAGAQGAMQVMPGTQVELGLIDPFDPRANVYAGSQYLMELIQRFGSVELALAAYNAGPAGVEKYGGVPPFAETREFVRRVMAYWEAGKGRAAELLHCSPSQP